MTKTLSELWRRGAEFLGTEHAIVGGAMSIISEENLVASISNAGGFGVIAGGALMPDQLKEVITKTKQLTSKNFGVNLITMHPNLTELIETCNEQDIKYVILAGGLPSKSAMAAIKGHGMKVICFAPTLKLGKMLVKNGVDALIVEGHEAGGHISPVATSVLAQEILTTITEVPIFIAGGIAHGSQVSAYLRMGASGVQMGTLFVTANESIAHPEFKKVYIKAQARDAVVSTQVDKRLKVIPVRLLKNKALEEFMQVQRELITKVDNGEMELSVAQLEVERFWVGSLRRAVIDGDIDNGSLMAGQSVGLVKEEMPTQKIIDKLIEESNKYL